MKSLVSRYLVLLFAVGVVAAVFVPTSAKAAVTSPSGGPSAAQADVSAASPSPSSSNSVLMPTRVPGPPATVKGPTDHYVQGQQPLTAAAVSGLPFNFTFTGVSYGIYSRQWVTGSGRACLNMAVTKVSGSGTGTGTFLVRLYKNGTAVGSNVHWPYDGNTYQYCFTGLTNQTKYKFFLGNGSGAFNTCFNGTGNVKP